MPHRLVQHSLVFAFVPFLFCAAKAQNAAATPSGNAQAAPAVTVVPATKATRPAADQPHPVLDRVLRTKTLNCGVSKEEEDYSRAEDHGNRAAWDIDFCKAVAVALLGSGAKLVVRSYPDEPAAVAALLAGDIDLLGSGSPTVANTAKGLSFTQPVLFDGQGFLLPNNPAVHAPADLAGKKICFLTGAAAEDGLHSYAAQHGITFVYYPFSEAGEMEAAFFTGNCDAVSSDITQLANIRNIGEARAAQYTILPQLIRQDPLSAVTTGDARFAALVNWILSALIEAEQLGITQGNVQSHLNSTTPEIRQLLGEPFGTGTTLGLDPHWAAFAIGSVGNYGEIFTRDLGMGSPFKLDRGENRLWNAGGLQFPLPLTNR